MADSEIVPIPLTAGDPSKQENNKLVDTPRRKFGPQAHPAAVCLLVGFVALFGLGFGIEGISRLNHTADLEAWGKLLISVAILGATVELARYFWIPTVSVTDDGVIFRRFLRPSIRLEYGEFDGFAVYPKTVQYRRASHVVEYLVGTNKDSTSKPILLPGFQTRNSELLASLTQYSKLSMMQLQDEEDLLRCYPLSPLKKRKT